jgi:hypothetical protein
MIISVGKEVSGGFAEAEGRAGATVLLGKDYLVKELNGWFFPFLKFALMDELMES